MSEQDGTKEPEIPQVDFSKLDNWQNFSDVGFSEDEIPKDILEDYEALSREVEGVEEPPPRPRRAPEAAPKAAKAPQQSSQSAQSALSLQQIEQIGAHEADVTVEDEDDEIYAAELAALAGDGEDLGDLPGDLGAESADLDAKAASEPSLVAKEAQAPEVTATPPTARPEAAMKREAQAEADEELDLLTGNDSSATMDAEVEGTADDLDLLSGADEGAIAEAQPPDLKEEAQRQIKAIEARIRQEKQKWVRAKKAGRQDEQDAAMRSVKVLKVALANQQRLQSLSEKGMTIQSPAPPTVMRQRSGGGGGSARAKRNAESPRAGSPRQAGDTGGFQTLQEETASQDKILKLKKEALRHHKAGRTQKAREILLQAKELEKNAEADRASAVGSSPAPAPAPAAQAAAQAAAQDLFSPLEDALKEALRRYVARARELVGVDKRLAQEHLKLAKQAKQLQEELQLRRKVPNAYPPVFRWTTDVHRVNKKIQTLGMEEMEICLRGFRNVPLLLSAGRSSDANAQETSSFVIRFDLGVPKDDPITGSLELPPVQAEPGDLDVTASCKVGIKRSRSLQIEVKRRKATFSVWEKKGWFRADVLHGTAVIPLAELLSKCEVGGWMELMIRDTRRKTGAEISLALRQHEPLRDQEIDEIRVQRLIVDPWPEPGYRPPEPLPPPRPAQAATPAPAETQPQPQATPAAQAPPSSAAQPPVRAGRPTAKAPARAEEDIGAGLSDVHKRTPLSPLCIISNHVLEYELSLVDERIAKEAAGAEVPLDLTIRKQQIEAQLQNLINMIQAGNLTAEVYLDNVKTALAADTRLVQWLRHKGRNAEALQVRKRVELMREELTDAGAL